jgi:pSer/pThr/pTyr-binding forkhead associated (FHA) protein/S1-C subfamily serine protease
MRAQFTFISGSRAGQTDVFGQAFINIGRHPDCTLRFDADKDLDVSARHASITLTGSLYVLRDLGSTNGTFVNGRKLTGDHVLATRDVIRFGLNGPQVEFTPITDARPGPQEAPSRSLQPSGTVVFGSSEPAAQPAPQVLSAEQQRRPRRTPGPGTTQRVKAEVARQTHHLRRFTWVLVGLLGLTIAAWMWDRQENRRELATQRALLMSTVDSLVDQIGALAAGSEGLKQALDSARSSAQQLRGQLAAAPNDESTIADLRHRLEAAVRLQQSLSRAATLDGTMIARQNRNAVALVFVQYQNGKTVTGTGFAVRTDPEGGFLVTNRHVVWDSATSTPAAKIGVVFEGTAQNFRADIVRLHPSADVALLRVSVHRGIDVVQGLADSAWLPAPGEPVASLGFPLGLDLAEGAGWRQTGMTSTLTLGTVARVLPTLLQLDSYGAPGSSGSPIFDRHGNVMGVLWGGQPGSNGRIVYGVPIRAVYQVISGD